jgi:hypothetical protein
MEVSMLEDVKFDLRTLDFRALTPEQWSVLKDQLIEQARQRRNADIRTATARAFASPENRLGAALSGSHGEHFWSHALARLHSARVPLSTTGRCATPAFAAARFSAVYRSETSRRR